MTSATNTSRKETERTKLIQEKCQTLLTQMLRDEDNKYCVDCDAKGPRWASWNLGVFLCIRCAGIHRNLGVHISRVKSVNLDTWTPEQVISLQQMGNSRARAVYEAQLPDGFRRPQTDTALESFIRAKYEHKKYLAREWVPPSPPKVDWAKEIDEELERQKRKKKTAQVNNVLGITGLTDAKKVHVSAKSSALPAPLPKPKNNNHIDIKSLTNTTNDATQQTSVSNDLLGLASPVKTNAAIAVSSSGMNNTNDGFNNFLSAETNVNNSTTNAASNNLEHTLEKEEEDFFNQGSLQTIGEKDKSGKLTKDSILALYGTAPQNLATQNKQFPNMFGMPTAYMHHTQQPQFMTPPNSTSMYNAPVMTAPTAFSSSVMNNTFLPTNTPYGGYNLAAQSASAGIMATGQQIMVPGLMQTNQNLLNLGMNNMTTTTTTTAAAAAAANNFQTNNASGTSGTLNQQFGNLNIGNVWQ